MSGVTDWQQAEGMPAGCPHDACGQCLASSRLPSCSVKIVNRYVVQLMGLNAQAAGKPQQSGGWWAPGCPGFLGSAVLQAPCTAVGMDV